MRPHVFGWGFVLVFLAGLCYHVWRMQHEVESLQVLRAITVLWFE